MSFSEAVATQGPLLRLWVGWMTLLMVATPVLLLLHKTCRRDGAVMLAAAIVNISLMMWLYGQMGFVRLLGLPHVLIWTPLAVYMMLMLRNHRMPRLPRLASWTYLVTIMISLVFDYIDVARWLLGERGPIPPA
jgi:hypothetical protein